MNNPSNPLMQNRELEKRLLDCAGYKVYAQMRTLEQSYYIFQRNHSELISALQIMQDPHMSLGLWNEKNRDKLQAFQVEVTRLLHNFLAAVKSLVDHTRILLVQELYNGDPFLPELTAKIKSQFADSELSHFVQDFRNYILHNALPMTSANRHYERGKLPDNSIQLDIVELRKWNRWSKPSKKYLSQLNDKKKIHEISEAYVKLVVEFHVWLKKRQEEIHKKEFDEMKALNTIYEKALGQYPSHVTLRK